jgi:hypothetical protein
LGKLILGHAGFLPRNLDCIVKRSAKTFNCRLSGWLVPSSHERTKSVAIPIFAANWPAVRFFSFRLT